MSFSDRFDQYTKDQPKFSRPSQPWKWDYRESEPPATTVSVPSAGGGGGGGTIDIPDQSKGELGQALRDAVERGLERAKERADQYARAGRGVPGDGDGPVEPSGGDGGPGGGPPGGGVWTHTVADFNDVRVPKTAGVVGGTPVGLVADL
jgi:hypothetical protein